MQCTSNPVGLLVDFVLLGEIINVLCSGIKQNNAVAHLSLLFQIHLLSLANALVLVQIVKYPVLVDLKLQLRRHSYMVHIQGGLQSGMLVRDNSGVLVGQG